MWPKVLICSLLHDSKSFLVNDWFNNLSKFTYPNFDVLIISNSNDKEFNSDLKSRCKKLGYSFLISEQHTANIYLKLANCYNIARDMALVKGYEYLCTVESDNFPPINGLEKLIIESKNNLAPVVITPYFSNDINSNYQKMLIMDRVYIDNWSIGRLMSNAECFRFMDGSVKPVHGGGMGFSVIQTDVLYGIKFRGDYDTFQDAHFFFDCHKAGVPVMMDTSILLKHINQKQYLN